MLTKTMIAVTVVLGTASSAIAQNSTAWDNPPGSAWQDKGNIEDAGGAAVLTPRGYRAADRLRAHVGIGAYAFIAQSSSRQIVQPSVSSERAWFRQAEGPEWN